MRDQILTTGYYTIELGKIFKKFCQKIKCAEILPTRDNVED
jgi:hypothetical protein